MEWKEAITKFLRHLKLERNYSQNTILTYEVALRQFGEFAQKHFNRGPLEVDTEHIRGYITYCSNTKKYYSAESQIRDVKALRSMYKYLVIDGVAHSNPARIITHPKVQKKLPVILTVEEVDAIVDKIDRLHIHCLRDKAIIETLYGTGIRSNELLELRFDQLMFSSGLIKVTGKGDKERLVPITPTAIKLLDQYLNGPRSTLYKHHKDERVFVNLDGSPMTRGQLASMVAERAEEAGISKHVTPHTFRHTCCTHLLRGGADLRAVQEIMGHETIATTLIYTHLTVDDLADTIRKYHPINKPRSTSPASPRQDFRFFHLAPGS